MPYYRLYHLNPGSGHIDRAEEIEAADDAEAVALVRNGAHDVSVELWQGHCKVLRLEGPANISQAGDPLEQPGNLESDP